MKPVYVVACVKKITVPQEHVHVTGLVVKTFTLSEHPLAISFLHFYIFILHIHFKNKFTYLLCVVAYVYVGVREQSVEIHFPQHVNTRDQTQKVNLGGKIPHVLSHLANLYPRVSNITFICFRQVHQFCKEYLFELSIFS